MLKIMSTPQDIYKKISQDIINGTLKPNQKITEKVLAEQFNTSRGPVRDALNMLQNATLVVPVPRSGRRVISFTVQQAQDLLNTLVLLECDAVKNAAIHATPEDIAAIKSPLESYEKLIGTADWGIQTHEHYNDAFHLSIIRAGKNQYIEKLIRDELYLQLKICRHQNLTEAKYRYEPSWQEHYQIFEAIKNKDPEIASILMQRHLSANHQEIIDSLSP